MRVALVCSLPEGPSGLGDFVGLLAPELARQVELVIYSPREMSSFEGLEVRPVSSLHKDSAEHIVYHVADEAHAGFCYRLIRRWGGTVLLHDWDLSTVAHAAYPELARPGGRGFLRALREGGWAGAGAWRRRTGGAPLNRTAIRLADAFLVFERELARAIIEERRSATPVGCLLDGELAAAPEGQSSSASQHARHAAERMPEVVRDLVLRLDRFPTHRTARKSVIRSAIEDADRRREEKVREEKASE